MNSPEMNKRILPLGMFVLPIVLVKAAAIMLGAPGPAKSSAAANHSDPFPAPATSKTNTEWTERHYAAAAYVEQLSGATFGASPFLRQATPTPIVEEPVIFEPIIETPEFELRAVISGDTGKRALINEKTYGVGDFVGETTWTVESIDGYTRSVTLRETESGRTLTISVESPM